MNVLLGMAFVAVLISLWVYKTFIDPSYSVNVPESIDFTEACIDGSSDLVIDGDVTQQVREELDLTALAIRHEDGAAAIVFFFESEGAARQARDDFASRVDTQLDDTIDQRGSLVLSHFDQSDSEAAGTFGACLTEVSDNRWSSFLGFGTKSIGRPFARSRND